MIINCQNCNKKFNLNSDLIGSKGRLLQCSSCDHKWFFKPIVKINDKDIINNNNELSIKVEKKSNINLKKNNLHKNYISKKKINNNLINNFIIIIISLISLIIVADTFKYNLSDVVPGLIIFLDNFYEVLYDLQLFLKDLVS